MTTKTRLLLSLTALGVVDAVVPLFPILALILIHVLLQRPPWFLKSVKEIYAQEY